MPSSSQKRASLERQTCCSVIPRRGEGGEGGKGGAGSADDVGGDDGDSGGADEAGGKGT